MSLIKNSFFNIAGYILPTLIAIPALGYLARALGAERFGLFTIAMAIIGYAGIFDAGLTRAVTREISIFRNSINEKKAIAATAVFSVLILGSIGGFLIFISASNICNLLNVSLKYKHEVIISLKVLSFSIPIFLVNQIWLAVLEGEEDFFNVNLQKWISSSLIAGLPAFLVFMIAPSLINAIVGLLFGRVIALFVNFIFGYKFILSSGVSYHKKAFRRLIRYGGWITVSNIVSPLMSYFDRFIVSHLSGANVVAFYSAPSEAVSRLSIIPGALSRAIFPKLSYASNAGERLKLQKIAYLVLLIICGPITVLGIFFSKDILMLWLGNEFGGNSAIVLKVLLIGYFCNCFAQIPFASIQASGRARATATLHLIELLPYLLMLFFLVNNFGIVGAAIAWSARMLVDALSLMGMAHYFSRE